MRRHRREFLADVGRGMLVASVGAGLAADLGLGTVRAGEDESRLTFGDLEPLVGMLQETPLENLLPAVVERINAGTDLKTLVSAAALANARTFGGQDYTGFHTFMALLPAWQMAQELPAERQALPILKVLYRNTATIHEHGGAASEVLHPVHPEDAIAGDDVDALRRAKMEGVPQAERTFSALMGQGDSEAYNDLLQIVQDNTNVHRVVLAWRSWALLDLTGRQHAETLLRQSVRFCADEDRRMAERSPVEPEVRSTLPRLLDEYGLVGRSLGDRQPEDSWIDELSGIIYGESRNRAADAVAAALAEGFAPDAVAQAIALAANRLVLRDPGRREADGAKQVGSVHGDSVGVHASDAANAWRNIAAVADHRNRVASLIVSAYHTAGQNGRQRDRAYPWPEHLEQVEGRDPAALLAEADSAIRGGDQYRACAVMQRYGEAGGEPRGAFDLLLRYATSEDGALHAEKYYRTVSEEFAAARPAFRWEYLAALARVTASEYGRPAPGFDQACQLLGV